ncbi:HAD family hydrolase [Solimonas marina]|uniref:HAD-IA family hydrolase n=1 Tax=Solimonas marina TaxID=2714601 RepID=A0A969WAG4_9GAMM|nr:HAD-IA family hydrolase [Solimonas marina]NKF22480.1 HAD-IA family hydrolase [Solimonas marina]
MNQIKLVIFDWDGTLADSAAMIVGAMQRAIAALQLPPRDDRTIRELIGLGLDDVLQRLYPEYELETLRALLGQYRAQWLASDAGEAPLFAGGIDALRTLGANGLRLAVATGKSRKGLDRSLAHHHELAALLVNTRCGDETAAKPDPRMLVELLQDEGLDAEQALMVGDTEFDAAMARAIGMPSVGVACGVHQPDRIRGAGAIAVLESVAVLPAWLRRAASDPSSWHQGV